MGYSTKNMRDQNTMAGKWRLVLYKKGSADHFQAMYGPAPHEQSKGTSHLVRKVAPASHSFLLHHTKLAPAARARWEKEASMAPEVENVTSGPHLPGV